MKHERVFHNSKMKQDSWTTKGRRALGGHELRGRVAKGLASMLWDTCKTVVCFFWLPPLWLHFQIPINGCLFSRSRSTFPSLSSFTAGRRLSASIVSLYKIVACTTCIMFYATLCVSCSLWGVLVLVKEIYTALGMLRLMVGLLFLGYTAATPLLWDGPTFQSDE